MVLGHVKVLPHSPCLHARCGFNRSKRSVEELLRLCAGQVLPELVGVLDAIPVQLPLVEAEPRIVPTAGDKEVGVGDSIKNRQRRLGAQGVRVGRQLGALQANGADGGVLLQDLLHHVHDSRGHILNVNLLALRHGVKARHVLAAHDHEAGVVHVKAALLQQGVLLRLQRLVVGSQNQHLVVFVKGQGDHRALHHRAHEDRHRGDLAGQWLESHHEAAVPGDAGHAFALQPLDAVNELLLDVFRHLAFLRHREGEARNHTEEHVVIVAPRAVDVPGRGRVVVIQADDPQHRMLLLTYFSLDLLELLLLHQRH
mmetsp:Transcript_126341/g.299957  ORF Transcript_126341/g.299957 Transcript_126341/m.299957 type:complete len:312 (+) Transcript_126341:54-989(+)